jgi:hypothetical protein
MRIRISRNLRFYFSIFALCRITTFIFPTNLIFQTGAEENVSPALGSQYKKPLFVFEENRGQFDPRVCFMARTAGANVFLTATEFLPTAHALL